MTPARSVRTLLIVCLAAAACRAGATERHGAAPAAGPPPGLAADALEGASTPLQALTAGDLADEAAATGRLSAGAVRSELLETGFVAASTRAFAVPGLRVRTVRARALRFRTPDGAARYLGWMRSHIVALVGSGSLVEGVPLPRSGFVFVHEPGGCCAKDLTAAVGVWRRGSLVLSVEALGAVDASDAARYATALDRAM